MSITLRNVAKEAGISVSTASRVINNDKYTSEDVKKKVLEAIEKINYRPNLIARGLKKSRTRTLGFIIPEILNPFAVSIINTMEHYSYEKGYSSVLCITENDLGKEKNYINTLKGKQIDGYIIIPHSSINDHYGEMFEGENVVSIDINMSIADEFCVKLNNFLGIKLAMDYLLSLGHRKIGIINMPIELQTGHERFEAFKKICNDKKINLNDQFIKFTEMEKNPIPGIKMIESAKEKTLELMTQKEKPTAIISTGIYVSIGILRGFIKLGTLIPKDISFISFDELYEYSDLFKTGITTIKQPAKEIGEFAIELLLKKIEGKNLEPGIFEMEPQLIIRDSCKRIN